MSLRTSVLAGLVMLAANTAAGQVSFSLLETPREVRWADFSLTRDGSAMGCLLDGAVYWWTASSGFRFVDGGSPELGTVGVAPDGSALIAARRSEAGLVPTIWAWDGSAIPLAPLPDACPEDDPGGRGFDLSDGARVAVGAVLDCQREEAFTWSPTGGLHEIAPDRPGRSRASAVSADGRTVVGYAEDTVRGIRQPAVWRDGGDPELILGPDRFGEALNVSLDGALVVGQAELGALTPQAFLWRAGGGLEGLGSLSGRATDPSVASAVSDGGRVVGWSGDELAGNRAAFLWTVRDGMRPLHDVIRDHGLELPAGLTLTGAFDISADGTTVVGIGRNEDWSPRFWRLRLPAGPLPGPARPTGPPQPAVRALPDTVDVQDADMLSPFPFGRRRF